MTLSIHNMEEFLNYCVEIGEYQRAANEFSRLFDEMPDQLVICFYLGLILVRIKNYQLAIRYLELAKSSNLDQGQRFRCLIFLGKAYADVKAFSKAERTLREALQTGVPEPGAYSALGIVFYERNMIDQAINSLQKALQIDPTYAGAMNNLGYILIETKRNLVEGLRLCREAVNLAPDNPAYRDSLAVALIESGKHSQAQIELEKALELDPNNPMILQHLQKLQNL